MSRERESWGRVTLPCLIHGFTNLFETSVVSLSPSASTIYKTLNLQQPHLNSDLTWPVNFDLYLLRIRQVVSVISAQMGLVAILGYVSTGVVDTVTNCIQTPITHFNILLYISNGSLYILLHIYFG